MMLILLALTPPPPEIYGVLYAERERMELMDYVMDPEGDVRWAGCNFRIPPTCFRSHDGQCLEKTQRWGCPLGGYVVVTVTGHTFLGWKMEVHTSYRDGVIRTEPATNRRPYTFIAQLRDLDDSLTFDLRLHRERREGWPEVVTANGTVEFDRTSIRREHRVEFKDFVLLLGDWETAETYVPLQYHGTLKVDTKSPGCQSGTFRVETVGTWKLRVDDLFLYEPAELEVNGVRFVLTPEGEVLYRGKPVKYPDCYYTGWSYESP